MCGGVCVFTFSWIVLVCNMILQQNYFEGLEALVKITGKSFFIQPKVLSN